MDDDDDHGGDVRDYIDTQGHWLERPRELIISPESQKALKERMESVECQELLDELGRCFVQRTH
jgi:hypothetical protein